MIPETGTDLGHGVRVTPGDCGGLVIHSAEIDLGLTVRSGEAAGTAVTWRDQCFEVVAKEPWRAGHRWALETWPSEQVMRVVQALDRDSVEAIAAAVRHQTEAARLRPWMWLLLPVLGMASTGWQIHWRNEWNFPAAVATGVSAVLESVFGAMCLIEFIAAIGGGTTIFPWIPRPLVIVGSLFLVEGLVRFVQVSADTEPVGSFFGLVASIVRRPPETPPPTVPAPRLRSHDIEKGNLELESPIQRRDWEAPGVLPYRTRVYRLTSTDRLGEGWVYRFVEVEADAVGEEPRFRLLPARLSTSTPPHEPPSSIVRVALLTASAFLAPRVYQERWAWEMDANPTWFTVFGAAAEMIGGISNLWGAPAGEPLPVLFGLFFVVEAMARFASVAVYRRPMGSLVGLPLVPLLDRYLPERR
jgi:hypothetical protein